MATRQGMSFQPRIFEAIPYNCIRNKKHVWEEAYSRLLARIELLKFFAEYLAGNLCAPVTASLDDFASRGINIGSVEKFIKSFDPGHFSGEKPVNSLFFPSKEALILTAIINWHTSSHSFKVRLNSLSFMLIGKSQLFLERGN
jgi:hypothetical protein